MTFTNMISHDFKYYILGVDDFNLYGGFFLMIFSDSLFKTAGAERGWLHHSAVVGR